MALIKKPFEIHRMRFAARVVARILEHLRSLAQQPGMNGTTLNQVAHQMILKADCQPNFLNYHGFPAVLCVSINDELVHGIPNEQPFQPGDLVSLDLGCTYRHYHADAALSFTIGPAKPIAQKLLQTTQNSLNRVIQQLKPGMKINQIGCIISKYVLGAGYYLTDQYTGHGIGRQLHEPPVVWNVVSQEPDLVLQPNMVLCIEPMVLIGSSATYVSADHWTVKSVNQQLTCHFEKMVRITTTGTEVLSNYAD